MRVEPHEADPNSSNNTLATGNLASSELADLDVVLTASSYRIDRGSTVTLQAVATNSGPSPSTNTSLVWQIPSHLTFEEVATSRGTCTSTAGQVTCQFGTLAVGATANVTLELLGATLGTGILGVHLDGAGSDPDNFQNTAQANIEVQPVADISVSMAESADPVTLGAPLQYVATVSNNGGDQAVVVANVSIFGATLISATPSVGSCITTATTASCTMTPAAAETSHGHHEWPGPRSVQQHRADRHDRTSRGRHQRRDCRQRGSRIGG